MKKGVSALYGSQPAVDHFNVEEVLQKAKTTTTDAGNIIDVVRRQVQAVVSPRAYNPTPAPTAALRTGQYVDPSKLSSTLTVSPWVIVGILVAVIGLIWFMKK